MAPRTVVIAESEPERRGLLAVALRGDGFEVREAEDAGDLLEQVTAARRTREWPSLIVVNAGLGKRASPVVRALRAWRCPTTILFMAGEAAEPTLNDMVRCKGCFVLSTPFDVDDFRTVVACLASRPADGPDSALPLSHGNEPDGAA